MQIIRAAAGEQKDQAIAYEFRIGYNTLRTQLSRPCQELGVPTPVGVVVAAVF